MANFQRKYGIHNTSALAHNRRHRKHALSLPSVGEVIDHPIAPIEPAYTTLMTRDYCGNYIYSNGTLERILTDNGYIQDGEYYFYIKDYQGNIRIVLNQSNQPIELNSYYPYGALMAATATEGTQPYKYSAKELDRENGFDLYDSKARMYDPIIPRTTTMDPLAEKYYSLSPYTWCAGNPINLIDEKGDSTAVLRIEGQHIAMLVKNENNRWGYFSINGNNLFYSGSHFGGRTFNDLGEHEFESPEAFLKSNYNKEGDKYDRTIANYNYIAAYIIPTTKKQDEIIRKEFVRIGKSESYSLNPLHPNHCATAVQKSLQKAGVNAKYHDVVSYNLFMKPVHTYKFPYLPSNAYNTIKLNNPKGYEIKKEK